MLVINSTSISLIQIDRNLEIYVCMCIGVCIYANIYVYMDLRLMNSKALKIAMFFWIVQGNDIILERDRLWSLHSLCFS